MDEKFIIEWINNPNNTPKLIYDLRKRDNYIPTTSVCLDILENVLIDYVEMIVNYDMTCELEENIMKSIEMFLKEDDQNISELQYDIISIYIDAICYDDRFIQRIINIINYTNNEDLKNVLYFLIVDEENNRYYHTPNNIQPNYNDCNIS